MYLRLAQLETRDALDDARLQFNKTREALVLSEEQDLETTIGLALIALGAFPIGPSCAPN